MSHRTSRLEILQIFGDGGEINTGVLPSTLGVPVFDTDFGRIAILLCWDMEFPEVSARWIANQ